MRCRSSSADRLSRGLRAASAAVGLWSRGGCGAGDVSTRTSAAPRSRLTRARQAPAFRLLETMASGRARSTALRRCSRWIAARRWTCAVRSRGLGRGDAGDRASAARPAAARVARGGEVLERRRPCAGLVRRRSAADEHRSGAARRSARFRWTVPYPVLLSGARPDEMDWYRDRSA